MCVSDTNNEHTEIAYPHLPDEIQMCVKQITMQYPRLDMLPTHIHLACKISASLCTMNMYSGHKWELVL